MPHSVNIIAGDQLNIYPGCADSDRNLPSPSSEYALIDLSTDQNDHRSDTVTCTGSYWRTADAQQNDEQQPSVDHSVDDINIPPAYVISALLDLFYDHVHSQLMFPFLPSRKTFDTLVVNVLSSSPCLSTTSAANDVKAMTEVKIALLLALCAYIGQLARSSIFATSSNLVADAADLWYEQAIWIMTHRLQEHRSVEGMQVLLLCALRSQGKGDANQACDALLRAVMMGHAMGIHRSTRSTYGQNRTNYLGYKVWGMSFILDLFISLQRRCLSAIHLSRSPTFPADNTTFARTLSLYHIISCINGCLYSDGNAVTKPSLRDLEELETKLHQWERSLPLHFKIVVEPNDRELQLGGEETVLGREVIELNILYQFALTLFYRHVSGRQMLQATCTFNELLLIVLLATTATAAISGSYFWLLVARGCTDTVTSLGLFSGIWRSVAGNSSIGGWTDMG